MQHLVTGDRQRESVIQVVAANLEQWTVQVKREKAIYHTLNKLSVDVTRKVLVAEAWCPVSGIQRVRTALQEATKQTSGAVSRTTVQSAPILPVKQCRNFHKILVCSNHP